MSSKKAAILQIGIALVYAIAIVIMSKILKSIEHKDVMTFLFIGMWFVTSTLISLLTDKERSINKNRLLK
jgi:drug/metabolite transporter (DMT)-like permease